MKIMTDKKLDELISKKLYEEYERRTTKQDIDQLKEKNAKLEMRVNILEAELHCKENHGVEVPVK